MVQQDPKSDGMEIETQRMEGGNTPVFKKKKGMVTMTTKRRGMVMFRNACSTFVELKEKKHKSEKYNRYDTRTFSLEKPRISERNGGGQSSIKKNKKAQESPPP